MHFTSSGPHACENMRNAVPATFDYRKAQCRDALLSSCYRTGAKAWLLCAAMTLCVDRVYAALLHFASAATSAVTG